MYNTLSVQMWKNKMVFTMLCNMKTVLSKRFEKILPEVLSCQSRCWYFVIFSIPKENWLNCWYWVELQGTWSLNQLKEAMCTKEVKYTKYLLTRRRHWLQAWWDYLRREGFANFWFFALSLMKKIPRHGKVMQLSSTSLEIVFPLMAKQVR